MLRLAISISRGLLPNGLRDGIELVGGSLCLAQFGFEVRGLRSARQSSHHAGQRHDVDRQRNFRDGHDGQGRTCLAGRPCSRCAPRPWWADLFPPAPGHGNTAVRLQNTAIRPLGTWTATMVGAYPVASSPTTRLMYFESGSTLLASMRASRTPTSSRSVARQLTRKVDFMCQTAQTLTD
jgi:hypothetical protein